MTAKDRPTERQLIRTVNLYDGEPHGVAIQFFTGSPHVVVTPAYDAVCDVQIGNAISRPRDVTVHLGRNLTVR